MRLAIVLYGHLRTYERCFPSLKKHVLDIYSPDVFIHTWDEIEAKTTSWHKSHMNPNKISKDELKSIKNKYNPISMRMETQNPDLVNDMTGSNGISIQGQKFMLYSLKKSDDLRRHYEDHLGKKYDYILKLRPDVMFFKDLVIQEVDENEMFISARFRGTDTGEINSYSVCDIVNLARPDTMKKACDAVMNFEKFYLVDPPEIHSPWIDYLLSLNIKIRLSNQIYGNKNDWAVLRKDGYA